MNYQPIRHVLRYHEIDCSTLHKSTRKKQFFEKFLLKTVTQPDLNGDPLKVLGTLIFGHRILLQL